MSKERKKRLQAAAIEYDEKQDEAPRLVASGKGYVAEKIIELAREADVPVVEDAMLVSALMVLELGEEIPAELYEAVAKILAFIYKLDKGEGH
ncbi:MAG: EscU/YscU/HrcU family type III secretion system export apparatus switch protein [Aminivibrio sp.]|jgi:flagellar biosynthesis protein